MILSLCEEPNKKSIGHSIAKKTITSKKGKRAYSPLYEVTLSPLTPLLAMHAYFINQTLNFPKKRL